MTGATESPTARSTSRTTNDERRHHGVGADTQGGATGRVDLMIVYYCLWTLVNVAFAAWNTVLYVQQGHGISLGAAIFCGALSVVSGALWVRETGR